MNKDEIFQQLTGILEKTFEIPAGDIQLSSSLYDDLDLDSIDAIDLVVKVQQTLNVAVNPDDFKSARTIEDVINIVEKIL